MIRLCIYPTSKATLHNLNKYHCLMFKRLFNCHLDSKHWLIHICSYLKLFVYKSLCVCVCVCVSRHACMHCMTICFVCMHLYWYNSLICLASLGWSDASDISDGRTRCSSRSVCRFATPVWRNRTQTTSLSSHTHWRGKWAILYREYHATYPHWCLLS